MPNSAADRNLLFGIMALQMDFVSRDALVAAMNAWVLDKAKPLGHILRDQVVLSAEHHALLEALVEAHLKAHAGDPQRSLAALGSVGSVRRDLEQVADADVQASLAQVSAARQDDAPHATLATTVGESTSSGLRYSILRPHAKGGLGEVFVARDEELHREVALKEIQDKHADHAESRARFLLEAEVTGGLEHPGIVPVYGLGHYGDGRPFYAMRFIRGDSLKHAIDRFHQDKPALPAGERLLRLRQLLRRFVDVCNAIAYAHSRGVLHRDMKPGNVMLGKYGETLVVDWGLAKALGHADPDSAEGPLQPNRGGDSGMTQAGSAVGTPAYMSPEQAAGRLDVLGPASDVCSLGATLYSLLTGRGPFMGGNAGEVLSAVQKGQFPRPRQVEPAVPAALEAVCLKAMALRPGDRYPSAQALAQDVERWLADEPVSAWREPLRVRAGRWVRRHQTAVTATAAAVFVALLLGGGGAFLFERQWAERRAEEERQEVRLRSRIRAALDQVSLLEGEGRWGEAWAAVNQETLRLGDEAPQALRERVKRARRDLDLMADLDIIRLGRVAAIEGRKELAGADRVYASEFVLAGLAREGDDLAQVAGRVRASAVSGALVAALDDWAFCAQDAARRAWLLEVARKADPKANPAGWRDRARQPATWRDRNALQELLAEEEAADQPSQLVIALCTLLSDLGGVTVEPLRRAQARHPDDFWLNLELGFRLAKKDPAASAGYYRAALALRPNAAAVRGNLGKVLAEQGKRQEAAEEFLRAAMSLDHKLAYEDAHYNRGSAEVGMGAKARFYEEAFAANPRLAEDLKAGHPYLPSHRYYAACCAAMAGCGQGEDPDPLDAKEKARLRRQALDWLRADLSAWAKQAQQPADRAAARRMLLYWKVDDCLAGVRGDALAKLPEAERGPWKKLWDDVDALLAAVGAPEAQR
jgi:tRNA A-37 threonylcarbamoyl transferase component Bud32